MGTSKDPELWFANGSQKGNHEALPTTLTIWFQVGPHNAGDAERCTPPHATRVRSLHIRLLLCCPSQLVTISVSNNLESTVASLFFGLRATFLLSYWILESVNAFDTKVLFPTKKTKTSSVDRNSSSRPLKSRSGYVDIAKYYPSLQL